VRGCVKRNKLVPPSYDLLRMPKTSFKLKKGEQLKWMMPQLLLIEETFSQFRYTTLVVNKNVSNFSNFFRSRKCPSRNVAVDVTTEVVIENYD